MTTYQTQIARALSEEKIPSFWIGYFREIFRSELHDQLLEIYSSVKDDVTKKEIATKLGRRPEQITRWLSSPSNIETDTISDFALVFGRRPRVTFEEIKFDNRKGNNINQPLFRIIDKGNDYQLPDTVAAAVSA